MRVGGDRRRSIQLASDGWALEVIDQTRLPFEETVVRLETATDAARAIATMVVRGAPLLGAAAAYGLCLALREDPSLASLESASAQLAATRPTAVNLRWALAAIEQAVRDLPEARRAGAAYERAAALCEEDVALCKAIGEHGLPLIERVFAASGKPVRILTHCNAGWLATVGQGTALSPVYRAAAAGIPVHVWVDETRPRNQGAALTAWELGHEGIPHTVIADNAGGHLMQRGQVDLCLVGSDRTTSRGDVCNKIGTYLKALAARESGVPFYVALPGTTIDWTAENGLVEIPIEERSGDEVRQVRGRLSDGSLAQVSLLPDATPVANPAFDVTPAHLVTALLTERGICPASRHGLLSLYPERR